MFPIIQSDIDRQLYRAVMHDSRRLLKLFLKGEIVSKDYLFSIAMQKLDQPLLRGVEMHRKILYLDTFAEVLSWRMGKIDLCGVVQKLRTYYVGK